MAKQLTGEVGEQLTESITNESIDTSNGEVVEEGIDITDVDITDVGDVNGEEVVDLGEMKFDKEEVEDIEEIEFDEEELEKEEKEEIFKLEGYDLSKYEEVLKFDNDKEKEEFKEYIKQFKELGFTQQQVEWYINKVQEENSKDVKKPTNLEIKENLKKNLTKSELRNYGAVKRFVADSLKGTEFEGYEKGIMADPQSVKLMNILYSKVNNTTTNVNGVIKPKESKIKGMSIDTAYDRLMQAMSHGDIDSTIKELKAKVTDKEGLKELLKTIGK